MSGFCEDHDCSPPTPSLSVFGVVFVVVCHKTYSQVSCGRFMPYMKMQMAVIKRKLKGLENMFCLAAMSFTER